MTQSTFDEQRRDLYAAIGEALSTWYTVEGTAMTKIFIMLMQSGNDTTAASVFNAAINLSTKRDMITAAIESSHASNELVAKWAKLDARIRKSGLKRNKLAHWRLGQYSDERGSRPALGPNFWDVQASGSQWHLEIHDVKNYITSFTKLARDIRQFRQEDLQPALPEIFPQQAMRPIAGGARIRRSRYLKAPPNPLQSSGE